METKTISPSGNRYNFLIVFIAALGSFTYGFNNAIVGSVFGLPGFFAYYTAESTGLSLDQILGSMNGIFFAGAVIGCLAASMLADKVGRVRSMQMICCVCVVGAIIQAASVHIAMLFVGRFIGGLGSGMINSTVPLYQSEVAPAHARGRMVGAHGFLLVTGYALAAWTGYGCYFETNQEVQWRLLFALQVVTPAALLIASPMLPESPRWLIAQARHTMAREVLSKLHSSPDGDDILARREFFEIEQQIELDKAKPTTLMAMLMNPSYRWRLLTGVLLQCLCQSTGVLVVNNYQVLLYNSLGLHGSLPLLLYSVYLTWAAFLNWAGSMIVDRVGRVRMLSGGILGCGAMLACFTALVAEFAGTSNKVGQGFAVFFLFAFVTCYGSCVDVVSWIYCSEIFPTHARARGFSLSVAEFLATAILFTQPAPVAFTIIGWKYYLVFIILSFVGAPVFWYFSPETKGVSLEEIGALFGDEVAAHTARGVLEVLEKDNQADKSYDVGDAQVEHIGQPGDSLGRKVESRSM